MSIVDLIYPKLCVGCKREGEYICSDCQKKLHKPIQICPMCCKESIDGWTHVRCKKLEGLDRLIIGLNYRGLIQDCIKKIKYRGGWDVIKYIYNLCDFPSLGDCIVMSVPMWDGKALGRGFNQADLVGKILAQNNQVPYLEVIERIRSTKPMFGLNLVDRKKNVSGAFKIHSESSKILKDTQVILVDDVWTTGATLRECGKEIKKKGAKEVWGITLAW